MTEITDLNPTDASNTSITGESLDGNVANMGRMDNTLQAILGMVARSIRTNFWRVLDNSDDTKELALDLSGLTTATTRTLTVPDANGTLALVTQPITRLTSTVDVTLSSTDHAFQIGASNAANLAVDANEIQARSNGAAATLGINQDGGNIGLGDATSSTTVAGSLNVSGTLSAGSYSATGATDGKLIDSATAYILRSSRSVVASSVHQSFANPNGTVGSITTTGTATAYVTSSDERLKTNFHDFDPGAFIDNISIYQFEWKVDGSTGYGPKAQELYTVFPDAVSPGSSNEPGDDGFTPWGYDASKLVPLLIREVQLLRQRVAALEAAR
jgi:hypothetical protein